MSNYNGIQALFGTSSTSLYDSLGQYASIQKGAYKTALKAYYSKESTSKSASSSDSKGTNKTEEQVANLIKSDAACLAKAGEKLNASGDKSLFVEKDYKTKDENGNETTVHGYDMDSIYKAVSDFVKNYNSFIEDASDSDSKSVLNQTLHLTNQVKTYAQTFGKAGITIGKDNKLSIDEDTFKKADIGTLKGLFTGNSSAAVQIATKASMIDSTAASEINVKKMYNNTGSYNDLSTGSIMDSLF